MNLSFENWQNLWQRMGAQGDARKCFDEITRRYSEPHRHYHNAEHIADCLREFNTLNHPESRNEIELALWLHDVIYDPTKSDNEEQSAGFTAGLNLPSNFTETVQSLVLATRHNAVPTDTASQIVVDIDLAILGQPRERFWRYETQIRQEYSFVPEPIFRSKRAEILEAFLKRDRIYQTHTLHNRYEKKARENLAESIRRLRL